MKYSIHIILLLTIATACNKSDLGNAQTPENYHESLDEFYSIRLESLTNETGWMRLAGMFWLNEGVNTFGSNSSNNVIFPEGFIPLNAGKFIVDGGSVRMEVNEGVHITVDGESTGNAIIYNDGAEKKVNHGSLEWIVIKRGDLIGIRLYNSFNPKVDEFKGFPRYDIDFDFLVKARLVSYETPQMVKIINILGQEEELPSPGTLEFEIRGEKYNMVTLEGGDRMFLILGDLTNRTETYQAGRYMYIDYPDEGSDMTIIDFNKAYNPPCSYSPYTTCQLPPPQNMLPIEIKAGEKRPIN
jgi:uncharacterized protein (DUF1684 family)